MSDCKSYSSPMATKTSALSSDADLPFIQPSLYKSLVGTLQYLSITRPDLAFVVNHACQFMPTPLNSNFTFVKRLLRYLKGTLGHGLHFSSGPFILNAYSDSDWTGNVLDKRSTIRNAEATVKRQTYTPVVLKSPRVEIAPITQGAPE
ncbi:uncharacterized protein LOC114266096 [Camellia sinensis]|uniref:uncharacterized protein LOC114266096 n=1 Tax=Camellia sinensis TaxID=4442 RepID=UPI001036D217|nr:uncharacterized protein LOC114266096 [Camellia sinensis]